MYAFIVKNDQDTWDVWNTLSDIPIAERKELVDSALASGMPITGQDLTEFGLSAKVGATWDGTEWTGGFLTGRNENSVINLYGYVCNNTIILIQLSSPNTDANVKISAIFESENSMIKVPDGQVANIGDIWDGEKIVNIV
jgi:hypothetical protein